MTSNESLPSKTMVLGPRPARKTPSLTVGEGRWRPCTGGLAGLAAVLGGRKNRFCHLPGLGPLASPFWQPHRMLLLHTVMEIGP